MIENLLSGGEDLVDVLTSVLIKVSTAVSFDIGTVIPLSIFGYSSPMSFVKSPKKTISVINKGLLIVGRGLAIYEMYNSLVSWLTEHSLDIFVACIFAFASLVVLRYIITLLWYGRKKSKKKKKNPVKTNAKKNI